jgi:hypothetical protein
MGLVIALWFAVIFSPFVAFAVNGKVDDSDWTPALVVAGVSLLALVMLHVRAWSNYQALPAALREEYAHGKLFSAVPNTGCCVDREFELGTTGAAVHLSAKGVRFSQGAWLGADAKRRGDILRVLWRAARAGSREVPDHVVAWRDIAEWQVHENSDTADYYRLHIVDGGHLRIRRPREARDEYELLDAVRSTGQTAVRLFCDIPRGVGRANERS